MSNAIQRLRAAKNAADEDRYRRGRSDGLRWAETAASVEDLEHLEYFREQRTCDCYDDWIDLVDSTVDSEIRAWIDPLDLRQPSCAASLTARWHFGTKWGTNEPFGKCH